MKEIKLVSPARIAALVGTLALFVPGLAWADSPPIKQYMESCFIFLLMVGIVFIYLFTLYLIFSFPAVKIYGEQWKHAIRPSLKKTALYILVISVISIILIFFGLLK